MDKQQLLDQIKADILEKNICPDLAKTATNLVMGDGNANADIVFIGEAPGKNEDLQGLPFVGAAGKFLNEMLAGIGLERKDIYITNIVKYRPPNNRDPLPEEKKAFWPYLVRQLQVIRPKVVVTLGRHSMEYFLPNQKISMVHGQPKRIRLAFNHDERSGGAQASGVRGDAEARTEPYEKYVEGVLEAATKQSAAKLGKGSDFAGSQDELVCVILPLYHPAAALYNGGMRETLIKDFSSIPQIVEKITKETN
jgi:uracil-DNA glycosylase family 4